MYRAITGALAQISYAKRFRPSENWLNGSRRTVNQCYELWTCPICWTVFIDAKIMSFSHSLLFWSLSLMERLYYCMSYCLVSCVVLYIIWLLCFVLVIFQRLILQACMRHCCFSEWGFSSAPPPPPPPHAFSCFYCQILLYFFSATRTFQEY